MDFPVPRFIRHDGLALALYEAGPPTGYPIILVHGWPELAYSWKQLIGPLAKAGYRVIALDLRGFGRSSAPHGLEHYGIAQIVSDIEAVLDNIGAAQAALIGHDWGGIIVWHAARMLQNRISHVIGLCTPHVRRAPADPIKIFRKRHGDAHYFVHFHDRPGEADALFSRYTDAFFRMMFQPSDDGVIPSSDIFYVPDRLLQFVLGEQSHVQCLVMSEKDLQVYISAYRRSGFHGGLNLYRNSTANWELADGLSEIISQPSLMISGENDLFLPPALTDGMVSLVGDLERRVIKGCGHWMMWEAPYQVNDLMHDWLARQLESGHRI